MLQDSLKVTTTHHSDSINAKAEHNVAAPAPGNIIDYSESSGQELKIYSPTLNDTSGRTTAKDSLQTQPSALDSTFLLNKYGFFSDSKWIDKNKAIHFVGISGDPIPYKLSNDIFVTCTLLACLFIASFVVSRSMHAIGVQIKNFFQNRNRNETLSLKSEGKVKNHIYVVILESFVLSLLFFSYVEFHLIGDFTTVSPYLLLFADMTTCLVYFALKYALYGTFNWTFFSEEKRELWMAGYNLTIFGKAVTLLPLVLIVLFFDLPFEVCIYTFLVILLLNELLVLFKTKQIFFAFPLGIFLSILYFCTLEMLPLLLLWKTLVRLNEYLLI